MIVDGDDPLDVTSSSGDSFVTAPEVSTPTARPNLVAVDSIPRPSVDGGLGDSLSLEPEGNDESEEGSKETFVKVSPKMNEIHLLTMLLTAAAVADC